MTSTPTSSDRPESAVPEERLGQYARLEEIGRGGQSAVWLAIDSFLGREVALKEVLPPPPDLADGSPSEAAWSRFLREARLTARLDHPSIVPIHELARRPDGRLFCAQKLIRGETLKARLAACATLEQRLALLPHLIDACQAVAYAHSRGVIHRDLKPSNIMVGSFGETVVVDWGLAKQRGDADELLASAAVADTPDLTVAGVALGTPAYMSPEQVRGALAEVDERSDVFSLGVLLYEVLTGRIPFEGADATDTMARVLEGRFVPVRERCPEAPPDLAAVAERALQRLPADRYPGAGPLAQELAAFRAGGRVVAYEYRFWELAKKFVARNRAASALGLAAIVVALGAAVAIGWQLHQARQALAQSFLERARDAARGSDWARAAGYYAAARVQADSREGRWGVALAGARMPRRILARSGPPGAYAAIGHLADGRGLLLAFEPGAVVGRELETERELWRYPVAEPPSEHYGMAGNGQVHLRQRDLIVYLDAATGRKLAEFRPETGIPCGAPPLPAPALLVRTPDGLGDLIVPEPGGGTRALMRGLQFYYSLCTVSPDGKQLAVQDRAGIVHVWDLPGRTERTTLSAPDASDLLFTAHGLAIVREQSIQVRGTEGGDFLIGTPGHHANGAFTRTANAVAPDGNVLAVGRMEANQADIIDLRARKVVSSVSYPAGPPRFAFAPAGDRLLVAGLAGNSQLLGWDARPTTPAVFPASPRMGVKFSRRGHRFLITLIGDDYKLALHDASGRLVRSFELGRIKYGNGMISGDGSRIAACVPERVTVFDDSGAAVARLECRDCLPGQLSRDGRRLATNNGREVMLWNVDSGVVLWRDSSHAGSLREPIAISPDGRRVAWSRAGVVYLHAEDAAGLDQLPAGEGIDGLAFDGDGQRLAVVTSLAIAVHAVEGLRPIFRVANPSWVNQDVKWSADDSALLVERDAQGSVLLDARTGARFAAVDAERGSVLGGRREFSPDLRYTISYGDATWSLELLPSPDDAAPEDSLKRVLAESGLTMDGVELTFATGAPR